MTGKERVMTALGLGKPDTVPVWELAFNEPSVIKLARHFIDEARLPPEKFFFDMEDMELFQLVDAFRAVAMGLGFYGRRGGTDSQGWSPLRFGAGAAPSFASRDDQNRLLHRAQKGRLPRLSFYWLVFDPKF